MQPFDYEKSIWGEGEANLTWSSPTSFRLRQALITIRSLTKQGRVLEIGCGAGQFIRAIKKIKPVLECYGCDISQKAIELARQSRDNVEYVLNTARFLPYENNFFDAVLIFDVLEHVEDVGAVLSEIRRVLKEDGLFYCFVPCEGDFLSWWHFLATLHVKSGLTEKYAGHIHHFSREQLIGLLSAHKFQPVRRRYSEHFLGQFIGAVSFLLMDRAAKKQGISQINNEQYFSRFDSKGAGLIKKIVNSLIYIESVVLSRIPSPNMHLVLRKVKR